MCASHTPIHVCFSSLSFAEQRAALEARIRMLEGPHPADGVAAEPSGLTKEAVALRAELLEQAREVSL